MEWAAGHWCGYSPHARRVTVAPNRRIRRLLTTHSPHSIGGGTCTCNLMWRVSERDVVKWEASERTRGSEGARVRGWHTRGRCLHIPFHRIVHCTLSPVRSQIEKGQIHSKKSTACHFKRNAPPASPSPPPALPPLPPHTAAHVQRTHKNGASILYTVRLVKNRTRERVMYQLSPSLSSIGSAYTTHATAE